MELFQLQVVRNERAGIAPLAAVKVFSVWKRAFNNNVYALDRGESGSLHALSKGRGEASV